MNNEPVAYGKYIENAKMWLVVELNADMPEGYIPLYLHPVKKPMMVLDGNRVYQTVKELTDEEIYEFTHRMIICSGQNPNAADINIFGLTRIVEDILRKAQEK